MTAETLMAYAAEWRADEARRRAIIAGLKSLEDQAAALAIAGELSKATAAALGAAIPAGPRSSAADRQAGATATPARIAGRASEIAHMKRIFSERIG